MSHTAEASPFRGCADHGPTADAMDTETSCCPKSTNYETRLTNEGDYMGASSVTSNNVDMGLLNNVNCNNNNNNIVSSKMMNCSDIAEEKEHGLSKAVDDVTRSSVTDEGPSNTLSPAEADSEMNLVSSAVLMCLKCNRNMPSAALFRQHVKEEHQLELNEMEEKMLDNGANVLIQFGDGGKHSISSINVDTPTAIEGASVINKRQQQHQQQPPATTLQNVDSNNLELKSNSAGATANYHRRIIGGEGVLENTVSASAANSLVSPSSNTKNQHKFGGNLEQAVDLSARQISLLPNKKHPHVSSHNVMASSQSVQSSSFGNHLRYSSYQQQQLDQHASDNAVNENSSPLTVAVFNVERNAMQLQQQQLISDREQISPPQLSVVQTSGSSSNNNSTSNSSCMLGKEMRNNHVSNMNVPTSNPQHQLSHPQSYESMDITGPLYLSGVSASQSHFQSRNSSKKLKCPKCNWHYKYKETLEAHMKEKHMDENTDCVYCNAGSQHPRLARGESYTCGYKPYRCEVCNYSTTTKGNLSIHMQSDKHLHNVRTMQHRQASEQMRKNASFAAAAYHQSNKADGPGFDDGTPSADKSLSLMTSGGLVVMDTSDAPSCNNDNVGNGHSRKRKVTTKPTVSSSNGNQIGNNSMQASPILPTMSGNNPSWLQGATLNQVFQAMQNKTNLMQGIFAGQARAEDGRPAEEIRMQMETLQQQLLQSQRQTAIVNQQLQQVLLAFHQQQQQILKQHIPGTNNIPAIQQRGMSLMQPTHQHLSAIHQMQMMKNFTNNISNGFGLAHSGEARIDAGSVKDLTARYVFSCHVCLSYGTDDIGALDAHVRKPRAFDTSYDPNRSEWVTRMRDDSFFCKLCKYSTMLKTNFNLHCKTEKHTNKINMINHVREGGPVSEWLIPYAINSNINPIATCNVCRFPANTLEKLKAHCSSEGHCTALGVCRLLDQMMKNSPRYNLSKGNELKFHCRVCDGFYTKFVIEVFRHLGEESHKMNQVQNKFNMFGSNITDIISIEQVSSENRSESSQHAENSPNQENTIPNERSNQLSDNDQQMLSGDNNNSQQTQEEKETKSSQCDQEKCTFGCDFETDTPKKMELHMITNHNCPLPVNKCPVCEDTLPNSRALRLHVYERHDLTSFFPDSLPNTNDLVIDESVDMTCQEKNAGVGGEGRAAALKNLPMRRSCDEQEKENPDGNMSMADDGFPNGERSALSKDDVKAEVNKELEMDVNDQQSAKSTSLPNLNNLLRSSKLGNTKNDEDSKRAGSCPPLRADIEASDEKQNNCEGKNSEVKDNRRRSNSLANEANSDRTDKSLVCSVCGEEFLLESALKNHFMLEHQSAMKLVDKTTATESEVNAESAERSKNQSEASSQKTEDDSTSTGGGVDGLLSKLMDPSVQNILKACGLPAGNPMSLNPNAAVNPFQQYQQQQQVLGLLYSLFMQSQYQNINPTIAQNPFIMQTLQQQIFANSLLAQRDQQNNMPGPRPPFPNMPMFNPLNGGLPNMDHVGFGGASLSQAANTIAQCPDQQSPFQQQQQQQHHLTMNNQPPPQPQQQQQQQQQSEVVRRPRTRISDDQLKILRENFDITTVPGEEQINSMVTQTGLPTKVIKHWFRNTLFKERQRSKDSPYNFNIPPKLTLEDAYNKNTSTSALSSTTSTSNADSEKVKQTNNTIQFPKQQQPDVVMAQPETVTTSGTSGKSDELNLMTHSSPSTTASSSPKSVIKPGFNLDLIAHRNNDSAVNFCNENPGQYDLSSFLSDNNIPYDGSGMSPAVAGSSSLRRPARTRFSDYQLNVLQNLFQKNPYPKDDDLEVLSRNLKLTQRVIVVWFQNARQKARKQLEQQQQQNPLPFSMQQQCTTLPPHQPPVRPKQAAGVEGNEFNRQLPVASFDQPFSSPKLDDDANRRSLSEVNRSFMPGVDLKDAAPAAAAAASHAASVSHNSDEASTMQQPMPNDANASDYQRRLWAMFDHLSRFNFIQKPAGDGSAGSEMIQERDRNLSDEDNNSNPMNMQLAMPPPRTTNPLKRSYNAMSTNAPASSYGNQGVSGSQDFSSIIQNSKASNEDKNGMSQKESKRLRTTITSEQLKILYEYYNSDHSPSRKVIEQIAQEVDLKKRVVQVWFQNTRARQRKGQGRSGMANRFAGSTSNCRVCPHCRTMLRTQEEFEHHIRTIHGDKSSFGTQLPPRDTSDQMNDKSGINAEKSVAPSLVPKTEAIASFQFRREDFERSTNFGGNSGSEFPRKTNNYNAASPLSLVKTYGRDRFENSPTLLNHMDLTTKTVSQQLPAPPQKLLPPRTADSFSDLSQNDNCSPQPTSENITINLQNAETTNSSFPGIMNQGVVGAGLAANFSPGQSITSITGGGGNSHTNNFVFPPARDSLNDSFQGAEQSVGQKRHRTHLSMTQIRVMRHCFRDCRNPHLNECEIIAKVIGLDKRVVQVWFQNNRAKEKKKNVPGASFPGRDVLPPVPVDGIQVASKCGICEPEVFFSDVNHARSHLLSVAHLQQVKRMIDNGEDRDNSAFSHTGSSPCSSFDGTFGSDIGSPVDCGGENNQSPLHHSTNNNSSQPQQDFLTTSTADETIAMQNIKSSPNHDSATADRDEAANSGATTGNQSDAFAFMRQYGDNTSMQMSGSGVNEGTAMRMQQASAWYTQVMQTISQIQSAKNHQQQNNQ